MYNSTNAQYCLFFQAYMIKDGIHSEYTQVFLTTLHSYATNMEIVL